MKLYAFITAVALLSIPAKAFSDDKEKAKEHFLKGKALVEEGAYEKAIVELKASYELNPVPIVLYNVAVCYDLQHKYANAAKYYRLYIAKGQDESEEKKKEVSKRIKELNKFLGILKLEVDVNGAEVIIDDKLVGETPVGVVFIETGEHDLTIRKTNYPDIKKKFIIVSGETTELSFAMQQKKGAKGHERPSETEPQGTVSQNHKEQTEDKKHKKKVVPKPVFWSLVGVTSAAAATSIVTGAVAVKTDKDAADMFTDEDDYDSVRNKGKKLALTTDVMIGITAGAAVTTLILFFFTDFKKHEKATAFISPLMNDNTIFIGYDGEF